MVIKLFGMAAALFYSEPFATIHNTEPPYSLLNSVDFHPKELIFCVAYTQNNKICFYKLCEQLPPLLIQTLKGPSTQLREPQHAVFSSSGQMLAVANWANRSLCVYLRNQNGLFEEKPAYSLSLPKSLGNVKPHGIAFSPSDQYLAVACGASSAFKNGLVLFEKTFEKKIGYRLKPVSIVSHDQLRGTPKGICFSPDSQCLLVSFSEPPSLSIFTIRENKIDPLPKQIVEGAHTQLARPEDIKLSPDGSYCAVSNSSRNTVAFYSFDKNTNTMTETPFWSLENPQAQLIFPHGLAFSSDGSYLVVTQFGHIALTEDGNVLWPKEFPSQEGAINIYRIDFN